MPLDPPTADRLLARLGFAQRPAADADGLRAVHRAYLAAVPYENLTIQLGEAGPLDDEATVRRFLGGGRGGYCFELNGVLALLLESLGFSVARHQSVVDTGRAGPDPAPTNHLALIVDIDGERWLADAGLGEGPLDPLPLRPGRHGAEPMAWTLAHEEGGGWRLTPHAWSSLKAIRIAGTPSPAAAFAEHHTRLSTSADSTFVQNLVLQRTLRDRIVTLRSRTLTERGPDHDTTVILTSASELAELLHAVFGIDPAALGPERVGRLWLRAAEQHAARLAAADVGGG